MKPLTYIQVQFFYTLKNRLIAEHTRAERMREFARLTNIDSNTRILDLGGTPDIWKHIENPLDITILNRPQYLERTDKTHHRFTYVEGDARRVAEFPDHFFDCVFSNSVIEHVGDEDDQRSFASEVRRLGTAYWVQTPCKWFPIEPHCGLPFWWAYPTVLREWWLAKWREKMPNFADMIAETQPLSRRWLRSLFPESEIYTEYFIGLPKSFSAYHAG